MAHAKGDARRLRAALDACGLALLAPKFAEHGVDDSCLPALEDEDLEAMGIEPASRTTILAVVKAPPETSSERVAALEARNRELADALDAAAAVIARSNRALLCLELGRLAATTAAGLRDRSLLRASLPQAVICVVVNKELTYLLRASRGRRLVERHRRKREGQLCWSQSNLPQSTLRDARGPVGTPSRHRKTGRLHTRESRPGHHD